MLDLSAAFDNVNHNIFLECLKLAYLTGHMQRVVIQSEEKGQLMTSQEAILH